MNGIGRSVTVTRHEWVLEGDQHFSEVYKVLSYMEAKAAAAKTDLLVQARDSELIVFYVEEKAKPAP